MQFLVVLLISVLPLTLTELPELSSLPNFQVANSSFAQIDKDLDGIMNETECINSFSFFKEYQSNESVSQESFVRKMVAFKLPVLTEAVVKYLFAYYDCDYDGVLDLSDFITNFVRFDRDGDGVVRREDFIRFYDELLTNATRSG